MTRFHPDWQAVADLLDSEVGPGRTAPAIVLLVERDSRPVFEHAAGLAGLPGREAPCTPTTVFDLASLTKPLVTAALTLDLIARGRLHFDTAVVDLLPAFAGPRGGSGADASANAAEGFAAVSASSSASGPAPVSVPVSVPGPAPAAASGLALLEARRRITVRHLLHHDAGLPAYRRYFESMFESMEEAAASSTAAPTDANETSRRRERLLALALGEPLERLPGSESVYSDIGFLVLGAIVEEVAGERLDRLAAQRLFEPLGIEDAWFVETGAAPVPSPVAPSPLPLERTAATGLCEWRAAVVHGVVQDENAFAMGGIGGHAGLFATARAVSVLAREWIDAAAGHGRVLDARLVRHAWNRRSGDAASTWALGWDTPTAGASSAGSRIGRDAVGHLGYTGTSLWIDRKRGAHVVLLTNRLACGRSSDAIRSLRPRLHDAVFRALDAQPRSARS